MAAEDLLPDDRGLGDSGWLARAGITAPVRPGLLPDGTPALVIGDVDGCAAFNHLQGDNPIVTWGTAGSSAAPRC